jgi:hypothetical protein
VGSGSYAHHDIVMSGRQEGGSQNCDGFPATSALKPED